MMRSKLNRLIGTLKESESGQAIVEMAIALPLLLVLLCGILDFGWIYMNQYRVENAAYAGARCASIYMDSLSASELQSRVEDRVEENLPANAAGSVTVTIDVNSSDKTVSVEVDYPVKTLTFVADTIVGSWFNASSTSVAVY